MRKILVLLSCILAAFSTVYFSGCLVGTVLEALLSGKSSENTTDSSSSSSNSNSSYSSNSTSTATLAAPKINSCGNVIYWDAVKNATEYVVYRNGSSVTRIDNTYFIVDKGTSDAEYTVQAKNNNAISLSSNQITVYQTTGFGNSETMGISLSDNKEYTIESTIKYVTVSGSAQNSNIIIQNRATDLIIELNSVSLSASEAKSCISTIDGKYDASYTNFAVTFIVNGENTLTGGSCTTTPPAQTSANSGKTGTNGTDGGSGIIAPKISVTGSGVLTLKGGDGGNGGTGAPSSGLSTSLYGDGGNGGDGGSGIKCTTFVMAMQVQGIVKSSGGTGGEGGSPGANGSMLSGALGSAAWDWHFGKDGKTGQGLVGTLLQFSGSYN